MTLSWQIHHVAMDNYHLQLARIPLSKWVEYIYIYIYREYHFYMIIGAIYCIIYTHIYTWNINDLLSGMHIQVCLFV